MADLMPLELNHHQPPPPTRPTQQQDSSNTPPATPPISIRLGFFLGCSVWALAALGSPVVKDTPHLGHLTFLPAGTGVFELRTALQAGQVMDGMEVPSNVDQTRLSHNRLDHFR